MEKAVLYLRLSKEDQDKISEGDDSASIKNQRLLLTDYALEHDYKIVDVYSDDNESGLYDDRPEFERMIQDAKLGKFSVIIAKTQARFSRNMEHIEKYLHHDFLILGIRFIGVADGVDTADTNNKKARQINGLVNEWYCEDLSKNIKSAFRAKMKDGQYIGSSCPYGYVKDPKNHNHLIIDEYAANVVREIFKMYIQGYSKRKIQVILNEKGILIPSLYKREVQGLNYYNCHVGQKTKFWSYFTINQILNNEIYIGNMVQHRSHIISYKDKTSARIDPSEWIVVKETHEPIISKEIFDRAKELQKIRTKVIDNKPNNDSPFSGLLFCTECNYTMTREHARGKFQGYICPSYKKFGRKSGCHRHFIRYDDLYNAVLQSIKQEARKILSDKDVDELKRISIINDQEQMIDADMKILRSKIDKLKMYKQKTYESYLDELISKSEYKEYITQYDVELEELSIKMEQLTANQDVADEMDTKYKEWVTKFSEYMNITELTRTIVIELIERIDVDEDSNIKIHYRFKNPYETD